MLIFYLLALIPFYFLGCFPTGLLVAKHFNTDITQAGSGNVGATNVTRILGKKAGLITLAGDLLKGLLAVLLAKLISADEIFQAFSGLAAILGHTFPFKFPAGKGVATTAGAFLALAPAALGLSSLIFLIIFWLKKIVSLASISAALTLPIFCMLTNKTNPTSVAAIVAALIIIYRHKSNLERLVKGQELPSFSKKN